MIGFRQNYFHILPNFGDFGTKMSFFRYIINQKRKIFIQHCSPVFQKPLISEMCIYITNNLCKWRLGRRGERCSTDHKLEMASLRITDEGSVPEMRIWSILLIQSDLKWCIHLSKSLFLYYNTRNTDIANEKLHQSITF